VCLTAAGGGPDDRQKHLLRLPLEAIIHLGHPLVRLAQQIDPRRSGRFAQSLRD
jgi:hypothetical protein